MKIHKQLLVRINYNTFVRLKAVFPVKRKESMASYFNRLAIKLEMEKAAEESTFAWKATWKEVKKMESKFTNSIYDYSSGNRRLIWNEEKQAMIMTQIKEDDEDD